MSIIAGQSGVLFITLITPLFLGSWRRVQTGAEFRKNKRPGKKKKGTADAGRKAEREQFAFGENRQGSYAEESRGRRRPQR